MKLLGVLVFVLAIPAYAATNKPTLREALTVPGAAAIVGETNGTYTAYQAAEALPSHAKVPLLNASQIQALIDSQEPNLADLRDQAQNATDSNATYLAIASPSNAQVAAQVRALTQQNTRVINALLRLIVLRIQ